MRLFPPPSTRVLDSARPQYFPGGSNGVLLIHGFGGSPRDMVYLAQRIATEGYTVAVPRLPGHGTNGDDFSLTGRRDWFRRVVDSYAELSAVCDRVSVVGLSMGGVLALLLASRFAVDKLVLAAPAILLRARLIALTPLLATVLRRAPLPEPKESPKDEDAAHIQREYWSAIWYRPLAELRRLQLQTRRRLRRVHAPILTIVSEADNTVPPEVARYIERRVASKTTRRLELTDSAHVVVNDCRKEEVADRAIAFLAED